MENALDPALEAVILAAQPAKQLRVFSVVWQGQPVWIKKVVPPKDRWGHTLQRWAARLWQRQLPLLTPTICAGGPAALQEEARRLQAWQQLGIRVPHVLGLTDQWLVLSHLGESVAVRVARAQKAGQQAEVATLLRQAAEALLALHGRGLAAGSGRLRDLVVDPHGAIGFIDLEEDPTAAMPLAAAQGRDLLLFLLTALRHTGGDKGQVRALWQFLRPRAQPEALRHLFKLRPYLQWAASILRPVSRFVGRDLREIIDLAPLLYS